MSRDSSFHKKHEDLTEMIYNSFKEGEEIMLPSRYVFVITNLCNLRCDFCFQDKTPRADAVTTDEWINVVKQLPDYARVTITGGEPFLFPGFKEVFSCVASCFDCNVITNGLLLNKERIDFLLSFPKFKVLSISIDDIGNRTRGLSESHWNYLVNILKYFVKRKKELGSDCVLDIKTMILDENSSELYDIHRFFVEEIGCDTHAFQLLKGSPIQHADYMFYFEKILEKSRAYKYKNWEIIKSELERIREYNLEKGCKNFIHPKFFSLMSEESLIGNNDIDILNNEEHDSELFEDCKFPWSSVHINVDGDLFPCLAVSMGNVKRESLRSIVEGSRMARFRELIKSKGSCEGCNRCGWLRIREKGV